MRATQRTADEADVNRPKMFAESLVRSDLHVVVRHAVNDCSTYDDENNDNHNAAPDEFVYGHAGYGLTRTR